jgi:acyl-CoA dehydrogenase
VSVGRCEKRGGARGETTIDFRLSADQESVRRSIERICERSPDDYWLARDRDGGFPREFHALLAADGWLGIAMPVAYGGGGLGITEAAIMMQVIAESGAGWRARPRYT